MEREGASDISIERVKCGQRGGEPRERERERVSE